jgi:hypothetical protein
MDRVQGYYVGIFIHNKLELDSFPRSNYWPKMVKYGFKFYINKIIFIYIT